MPYAVPTAARAALGVQYAGLAGAGVWFITEPAGLLESAMGQVIYTWAGFMAFGGVLCFLGVLTKIWFGEFAGLVLLATGNLIWGGVLLGTGNPTSSRYGVVLIAWIGGFAYRWWVIKEKAKRGAHAAKERRKHG